MEDRLIRSLSVLVAVMLVQSASAREWLIEVQEERPVPALESIAGQLAPGDLVRFSPANSIVRAEIVLKNLKGSAEKPIVIDGNGCTFLGTEVLNPSEWSEVAAGLYKSTALPRRINVSANSLQRWFFVFDGQMQRMGRISKGKQATLPKPEALQPGQWTYDQAVGTFYVKLAEGQTLASVEVPERQSGVAIAGSDTAFLEIRNVKVKNFYNDGYNIHGKCEAVRFVNITATSCGDDGLSAHEDCAVEAVGFRSEDNATGFCNVNRSRFVARDLTLVNNLAYEIYVTDSSLNTVANLTVESTAPKAIIARGSTKDPEPCRLAVQAAKIKSRGEISIEKSSVFSAEDLETDGCPWEVNGEADVRNSRIIGGGLVINGEWKGAENTYSFPNIIFRGQRFAVDAFAAYQQASGQDNSSTWSTSAP